MKQKFWFCLQCLYSEWDISNPFNIYNRCVFWDLNRSKKCFLSSSVGRILFILKRRGNFFLNPHDYFLSGQKVSIIFWAYSKNVFLHTWTTDYVKRKSIIWQIKHFGNISMCVGVWGHRCCEYMQTCPKWQSPWGLFLYILSAFLIAARKKVNLTISKWINEREYASDVYGQWDTVLHHFVTEINMELIKPHVGFLIKARGQREREN